MNRSLKIMVGACGAAALLAVTASAAGASSANPTPSRPGGLMRHIGAEATYGIKNGHPYMQLIKGRIVGKYKLSEIKHAARLAAANIVCTEYISDVSKVTGAHPFTWETQQTCTGPYYQQRMHTQMWRSSYSGPRGYGQWAATAWSGNGFISKNWTETCNYGTGLYTYYPVMYGEYRNGGGGVGPTIRSDNQLDAHCGPSDAGGPH